MSAATFYRRALDYGHRSAWTHANLGLALLRSGDPVRAVESIDAAIRMTQSNSTFWYYRGCCLVNTDYVEAIASFKTAIAIDPTTVFKDWGIQARLRALGRGSLAERMDERLQKWYVDADPTYRSLTRLSNKARMREFIAQEGIALPSILAHANSVSEIDLTSLPNRFVAKPDDGADSKGVIVVDCGYDLMGRRELPSDLASFLQAEVFGAKHTSSHTKILIEELLEDVDYRINPQLRIPRDFKCFAAGGRVFWTRVYDRNAPPDERSTSCYGPGWIRIPNVGTEYRDGPDYPKPEGISELLHQAEALSRRFPCLMRFDFYLTTKGPVFGEFTTYPAAGRQQTAFGERTMLQLWEAFPDY